MHRGLRAGEAWYAEGMREAGAGGAAFADRALAHLDALFNLARHLTGSAADGEDLVQETYARALASADRFDGDNLKAWLFKILRNVFVDSYRSRRRQLDRNAQERARLTADGPVDADLLSNDVGPDQLRAVVASEIEAALAALSDDARAVILLDLEGLSESEMADVLGCAPGTIKSRLSRARAVLRHELKDYARK